MGMRANRKQRLKDQHTMHMRENNKNPVTTIIIGASMIKGLHPDKISNTNPKPSVSLVDDMAGCIKHSDIV